MKCWICGKEGNTGEHFIKASDLRSYFGKVNQSKPLYLHRGEKRRRKLQSVTSRHFKSSAPLCEYCNSTRTQKYDRSWESMSDYLREHMNKLVYVGRLNCTRVFPGETKSNLKNIQLYFVKLFGCRIAEVNLDIDLSSFSEAMLQDDPHPHIFLEFGNYKENSDKKKKLVAITEINVARYAGTLEIAYWYYIVGNIAVKVVYSPRIRTGNALSNTWNPIDCRSVVKIVRNVT